MLSQGWQILLCLFARRSRDHYLPHGLPSESYLLGDRKRRSSEKSLSSRFNREQLSNLWASPIEWVSWLRSTMGNSSPFSAETFRSAVRLSRELLLRHQTRIEAGRSVLRGI